MLRDGGEGFVEAIEASGLEPPDTPLLEWSDLMTIEESLEREAVAEMLEQAVDEGHFVPGAPGWRQRQAELVERHLIGADGGNATPLGRICAARREAWLERVADNEHALLEAATPTADGRPTLPEAEAAIEPLLWLLGLLAAGVKRVLWTTVSPSAAFTYAAIWVGIASTWVGVVHARSPGTWLVAPCLPPHLENAVVEAISRGRPMSGGPHRRSVERHLPEVGSFVVGDPDRKSDLDRSQTSGGRGDG